MGVDKNDIPDINYVSHACDVNSYRDVTSQTLHTHTNTHTQTHETHISHTTVSPTQCLHPGVVVDVADSDDEDCPFKPPEDSVTPETEGDLAERVFAKCSVSMMILMDKHSGLLAPCVCVHGCVSCSEIFFSFLTFKISNVWIFFFYKRLWIHEVLYV